MTKDKLKFTRSQGLNYKFPPMKYAKADPPAREQPVLSTSSGDGYKVDRISRGEWSRGWR